MRNFAGCDGISHEYTDTAKTELKIAGDQGKFWRMRWNFYIHLTGGQGKVFHLPLIYVPEITQRQKKALPLPPSHFYSVNTDRFIVI